MPAGRAQSSPRHAEPDDGPVALRGLTRRKPGGHLPSFGFGSDDFRTAHVARDAVAERAELEAFALGTAQAAAARLKRAGSDLVEPNFGTQERSPASQPSAAPEIAERPKPAATERPTRSEGARHAHGTADRARPEPDRAARSKSKPAADERPAEPRAAAAATGDAQAQPRSRGGLTRRTPGSHLSEYLRSAAEPRPAPTRPSNRDAAAEREALDSFLDGLARASSSPDQVTHR